VYALMPWSLALFATMAVLSSNAPDDRRMVVSSAALTLSEVAIITAAASLFSSFSSPFLTGVFTLGVFITGRSADTLAHMPAKVFGQTIHDLAAAAARVVPNLTFYVPPRALLTGEVADVSLRGFMLKAIVHAVAYSAALLVAAAVVFRKRDFQ